MHRTNICFSEPMLVELRRISKEKGISLAELVRRIIDEWIESKK